MADGTLHFDTKIDNTGFEKGLSKIQGIAKSSFAAIGASVAAASTAISAGAAAVVEFGSAFETSMAKASTLFGDVAVDTAHLNSEILALSGSTGLAASTFGDALYSALSAGIPATEDMSDALGILESSAKLATAGFTDIDTAMSATAKTLNAYGLGAEEAERIQGILIQTQNKGITTVGELGASLAQVTPTAAAFGVSFEQVGAALAAMTAQGTPTAQATTQLRAIIAELGKSGTVAAKNLVKAAKGTEYAGMTFAEMMASGADLGDVLGMISEEAEKSGKTLVDMFSSSEAGTAALSIMAQDGAVFAADMEAMANTAGLVDDAFDKMMETFAGQKSVFMESGKNLAIAVYNGMDGELTNLMKLGNDMLAQLAEAFETDGAEGLISAAGSVVGQLVVKAAEYAPVLAEAAVSLLTSLAQTLIDSAPIILEAGVQVAQALITGLFGAELGEAFGELGATALETFNLLISIVSDATATVGPLLGDIALTLLHLVNAGLEPVNAVLGFVANHTRLLTAAVVGGVAAWTAYMVVTKVSKAVSAMSKAMALLKTLTDKETISTMLSTGSITAKHVVLGVLTRNVTLATAKQALYNATVSAFPGMWIIGLIAALVAGISALVSVFSDSTDETDANAKAANGLAQNVRKLCDAQWELYDSYEALDAQIPDVNALLSDTGKTLDELDNEISSAEKGISSILSDAIEERRELREQDLKDLREYMEKYRAAVSEQFDMYLSVQNAENLKISSAAPADSEELVRRISGLNTALENSLSTSDELLTQSLTYIENMNKAGYYATEAEYQAAIEAETELFRQRNEQAEAMFNTGYSALQQYAAVDFESALTSQAGAWKTLGNAISEAGNAGGFDALTGQLDALGEYSKILGADAEAMSDFWYTMNQSIASGAELTDESKAALSSFLGEFEGLDGEMSEAGKNVLLGLIGGLRDEIPGLSDTSEMSCDAVVDTLVDYFGIHSPSTLMYEKGGYIMDGLIGGISDKRGALSAVLTDVAGELSEKLGLSGLGALNVPTGSGGSRGNAVTDALAPLSEAARFLRQAAEECAAAQLGITRDACEQLIAQTNAAASAVIAASQQTAAAMQSAVSNITYHTSTSQSLNFYTPTAKPSAVARAARSALEVK